MLRNATVRRVDVTPGLANDSRTVVRGTFAPADRVVLDRNDLLKEGVPATSLPAPSSSPSTSPLDCPSPPTLSTPTPAET